MNEYETERYFSSKDNSLRKLPEYKGYTIDCRLRQIRKITEKVSIFLDFDSSEGDAILSEYINTLDIDSIEFKTIADAVV